MFDPPRQTLRQTLRRSRRALQGPDRGWREAAILDALRQHPVFRRARRIALYWPADGEVDLRPLASHLRTGLRTGQRTGQRLFLPVLAFGLRLRFVPWRPGLPMRPNRFRIPEPCHAPAERVRARELDLILMPLVGFDDAGNRLGMGGGFYDRTLAFRHARRRWRKPFLLGVAFGLQRCAGLPAQAWDVPLDGILTEDGIRLFDRIQG